MSAEWCDTDPVATKVFISGEHFAVHAVLSVKQGNQRLAHQAKISAETLEDATTKVTVQSPPCNFKVRLYTSPGKFFADDDNVYAPNSRVDKILGKENPKWSFKS